MSGSGAFADRWDQVQENLRRLAGCQGPRHDFRDVARRFPNGNPASYRCAVCGGVLGADHVGWYLLGLAQGRRNRSVDEALNSGDGSYRT